MRINSQRRIRSDLARIMVGSALVSASLFPAHGAIKSWNASNGSWFTGTNWSPNGTPGAADTARIGNLAGVQNSSVILGSGVLATSVTRLEISDGMTLDLNHTELVSIDDGTSITGANSRLIVRHSGGPNEYEFISEVEIGAQARLELSDGAAQLTGASTSAGIVSGVGNVRFLSSTPFVNNGVISAGGGVGLSLESINGAVQPIDLDGTSGNGTLEFNTPFEAVLEVTASNLTDSFSGTIELLPASRLEMHILSGWTADAGAVVSMVGPEATSQPARLEGSQLTFGGWLQLVNTDGQLDIAADVVIEPSARVDVSGDSWVRFGLASAETTINGGTFNLTESGRVLFYGPTTMHGGVFNSDEIQPEVSDTVFEGETTWAGQVTFNGAARQNGPASTGAAAVVNAEHFDMDGVEGDTTWTISYPLVINAQSIDGPNFGPAFDGTLNIAGGFYPGLTVNLTPPGMTWYMDGVMNLTGDLALFVTRLSGTPLVVNGDVNVTSGKVQIGAGTTYSPQSAVNLAGNSAQLRMYGRTRVQNGATFIGGGMFANGVAGDMTLDDGVSTDQVGLTNNGILRIADGGGVASVDRFQNTQNGRFNVSVGGFSAGENGHDLLIVSGQAVLDGTLDVDIVNYGTGQFSPQVDDEFTIISAAGGISGTFDFNPVTCAGEEQFHWVVVYDPNEVSIRLTAITSGLPGDVNCDCVVSVGDIGAFVLALTNPADYAAEFPECSMNNADVNNDGVVSVGDIAWFVNLLTE